MTLFYQKYLCINHVLQLLAVACVAGICAACVSSNNEAKPIQHYPINSELVTFTVGLRFDSQENLAFAHDEQTFKKFLREFARRGRSPLTVSTTPQSKLENEKSVIMRLVAEGVNRQSIILKQGAAPKTDAFGVMFSFRGYMVDVPICENWLEAKNHNQTNLPHANYGCSYQRNIGLMLADPGDLVAPKGISDTDTRRMDEVIRVFRRGEAAGAAVPKDEKSTFADPT